MACIEMLGVERNAKTARTLAYYQGVSAFVCKQNGIIVVEPRVSTARSIVLDNGGLSKDQAWEIMKQRYPKLFARKDQGGEDEMDAAVLALAGPDAAEM